MPDSIVPIVRRSVRKTTPAQSEAAPSLARRPSTGAEASSSDKLSPPKLTRSWLPTSSPTEERRRSLISDASPSSSTSAPEAKHDLVKPRLQQEPVSNESRNAIGGFPTAKRDNLPALPVAKSRPIKTSKDLELERKIMQWMVNIVKEKPESPSQYDRWIQDGTVLSKLMIGIVFNSVPVETVHANWGSNPVLGRVKSVIHEMRRYGVTELFEPADLMELRNIPKVTKSLAQLCKLATADSTNLLKN